MSDKGLCEQARKKVLLLPFSGEGHKLTRLLSSATSIRILEALWENCLSASELSARLDLRLNTLHYHLNSLLEAGLIRVAEIGWSQKGRKIKFYTAAEKLIVLVPGKGRTDQAVALGLLRQYLNEKFAYKNPESCLAGV